RRDRVAVQHHRTRPWRQHPRECLQQGRLSAAVRADDDGKRLGRDRRGQPLGDHRPVVGQRQIQPDEWTRVDGHTAPLFHSRPSRYARYTPPKAAVGIPTGNVVSGTTVCAARSATTVKVAPVTAATATPGPAARVSRRAICGATSATNATGPMTRTAPAVRPTPTSTAPHRIDDGPTPSAVETSSPISSTTQHR